MSFAIVLYKLFCTAVVYRTRHIMYRDIRAVPLPFGQALMNSRSPTHNLVHIFGISVFHIN